MPLARLLAHAADALQAVRAGQSLNDALARCPAEARPGTQALSFHALRWLGSAQFARAQLAPKAPPPAVDALLLTAIALLWPAGEPAYADHTLVDQAVTAARTRGKASAPFVNAVLRRFLRERDAIVAAAQRDPLASTNHPAWWVERLKRDWPDQWPSVLAANNQRGPMTLRVNARRGTAPAYVERLAVEGIAAQVVGPQAVTLAAPCPVTRLPGFAQGDVSVQDAAAQLAAPLLIGDGLPPGAHVLDACAAPGGKTAHLLELADLDVLALDSDAQRLQRVHETLQRLSLSARTRAADAGDPAAWWDGRPFDAILLDAPCSASGIVRRHPDVRWLRRPGDIPALAQTQARLLDALWPLLRPGGRLLYCTCSVFKAEGQDQIDAFLQRQGDASVAKHPPSPGHLLPLPDNQHEAPNGVAPAFGASPDGFFYALLQKR
ncbi:MAG TPA: 16S rRNA (cytosine(967)-C(5))-methyltransferase RsmB [Albitalea sp.]|nr:16S rRNA (cytosine(967)-C(5))-methyltransferase RsmB [Albitalea sp.]